MAMTFSRVSRGLGGLLAACLFSFNAHAALFDDIDRINIFIKE